MRIACPSCAAEYEVPASRLTPRKMVRCARCGGEWIPVHAAEEAVQPPEPIEQPSLPAPLDQIAPIPAVTAMDRLAAASPPSRSRAGLVGAWMLTVVILLGAVAAAVTWRDVIIRTWPPSARILGTFGTEVPNSVKAVTRTPE